MKYTIGDKIVLLKTGEEGHVTALLGKDMLEVSVGGTLFPVFMDAVDHPYLKWFTEKKPLKKPTSLPEIALEKISERKQRLAKGVYCSFIPVFKMVEQEEQVDVLKVHLLNELPVAIDFDYDMQTGKNSIFRLRGTLHAFGNLYLHPIPYPDMNDQPRFMWSLADNTNSDMVKATGTLRIKPPKLFEHINDVQFNGDASFSYLLIEDFVAKANIPIEKPAPLIMTGTTGNIEKHCIDPPRQVLDLHIEALIDDYATMTNTQIILVQLATLERFLQIAIVHRQERMIVIHGIGTGKLKDEVHKMLRQIPEAKHFKHEHSHKYGFGATEILFKYK